MSVHMQEEAGEPGPITRMDRATTDQWRELGEVQAGLPRTERVITALQALDGMTLGFGVSQLTHALQTATRAERAGADDEMIVGSLCHDIGRLIPGADHARLSAKMLRPYVRDEVFEVIRAHWAFQLKYTYRYITGVDPDQRRRYRRKPWYSLAECFADEWDQRSFDPEYDTLPLEHFEPLVRQVFDSATSLPPTPPKSSTRQLLTRVRDIAGV